jgi:BirA family biotin operon repressor/biotin-[acetyl-CoA-carboxylase] ligase
MNGFPTVNKTRINLIPHPLTLIKLDSCDSTNNVVRSHLSELTEDFPVGISARIQTKGRGRNDRTWFSSPGKGLYISLGFFISSPQYLNLLSLIAGISISETLAHITKRTFTLKWPNDIFYKGQKIAGVLIENIIKKDRIISICGMGINVNYIRADFPGPLKERAVSLKMITRQSREPSDIESPLIRTFFKWLHILEKGETSPIVNRASQLSHFQVGEEIVFTHNKDSIKGQFLGINQNGGIEIQLSNGKRGIYFSGEIDTDL